MYFHENTIDKSSGLRRARYSNGDPNSIGAEFVYTWLFEGMYNLESAKNETTAKNVQVHNNEKKFMLSRRTLLHVQSFERYFYLKQKNLKIENDTNFISSIISFYISNTKNTLHMIYNEAGPTNMERDSIKTYKVIAV